jgi:hypothetical protein
MDCKATVHIGEVSRGGRTRGDQKACDHDWGLKEKYIPCGIVDEDNGQLRITFGSSYKEARQIKLAILTSTSFSVIVEIMEHTLTPISKMYRLFWRASLRLQICLPLLSSSVDIGQYSTKTVLVGYAHVLVQWHGLQPTTSGFVPLSMAEFSL